MCLCLPNKRKTLKVEVERHAFAYVFEGDGMFASSSKPFGVLSEKQVDGEEILFREPAGDRSLVLFDAVTRSPFRPANKASVSCWCRESRSRSPSLGTGRS